jgi:hypothetical protein
MYLNQPPHLFSLQTRQQKLKLPFLLPKKHQLLPTCLRLPIRELWMEPINPATESKEQLIPMPSPAVSMPLAIAFVIYYEAILPIQFLAHPKPTPRQAQQNLTHRKECNVSDAINLNIPQRQEIGVGKDKQGWRWMWMPMAM